MFAYCNDNPVNGVDTNGERDRFVGFGIQIEGTIGDYNIGLEFIVYFDNEITNGGEPVVAVYIYDGFSVDTDAISFSNTLLDYSKEAANLGMSILASQTEPVDVKECLIAMYAALLDSLDGRFGGSISVMAVFGNEGFHTTDDYRGTAHSYYGRYKNVKVTYSKAETSKTISLGGAIGSKMLFAAGFGVSHYEKLY